MDFEVIVQLVQTLGLWSIFVYLYISERKDHNVSKKAHMDDLREIAGLKHVLARPQQTD